MAKRKTDDELETLNDIHDATVGTALEPVPTDLRDLFSRTPNSVGPVRTLHMKRVLTRPLVSMSKRKQLAVECESEMYLFELPLTGRGGGMATLRVFDATELVAGENGFTQGDKIIVICHEIMCSALMRAGYAVLVGSIEENAPTPYVQHPGKELKGSLLGFVGGDIADGKRYRSIYVAELE